jgi:uncharacterized membrane protein
MEIEDFFTAEQKEQIRNAIEMAEHKTSGEIRLHIENECPGDALHRAMHVFHKLHMHKTKYRNAVLFYLAIDHKKLAIVGDEEIHKKVPEGFWDKVKEHLISRFKVGNYALGLCEGLEMTLKIHFPRHDNDKNQLSDDISYGHKKE